MTQKGRRRGTREASAHRTGTWTDSSATTGGTGTANTPRRPPRRRPYEPDPGGPAPVSWRGLSRCAVEQRRQRRVPGRQRLTVLEPEQVIKRASAHLDPRGLGEMRVNSLAPGAERQPVLGFLTPRHLLNHQLAVGRPEHGAAEQEQQWHLAAVEAGEVPGRADLEVITELDRQIDVDAAGKAGDHRRHGCELHGLERVRPALGIAEKVVQPLRLGSRVAPPGWLDPDLAAQRDRVDPLSGRLSDLQAQRHRRRQREPVWTSSQAVEGQLRHGQLSWSTGTALLRT